MPEKDRSARLIAVVALCVAVVGLSIGFAAFSDTLTISSNATVKPDPSAFDVVLSTKQTAAEDSYPVSVSASSDSVLHVDGVNSDAVSGTATLSRNTISGLSADFTAPGQKVVYKFYAHNAGSLDAFLNSVTFGAPAGKTEDDVDGYGANAYCRYTDTDADPAKNASGDLVEEACPAIKLSVAVGGPVMTGTVSELTGHSLDKGQGELVTVTIDYPVGSHQVDGPFSIVFGDVTLAYSSVD